MSYTLHRLRNYLGHQSWLEFFGSSHGLVSKDGPPLNILIMGRVLGGHVNCRWYGSHILIFTVCRSAGHAAVGRDPKYYDEVAVGFPGIIMISSPVCTTWLFVLCDAMILYC